MCKWAVRELCVVQVARVLAMCGADVQAVDPITGQACLQPPVAALASRAACCSLLWA